MPHVVEDRILESSVTAGAGNFALAGAVVGFRRFSAVCAIGDTVPYFIEAIDSVGLPTGEYEYGIGTYSAANTLARTRVLGSSNAGALVNFAAASKNVGIAMLGSGITPAGSVFFFPGSAAPAGFVKANGALLSRAQYPALWSYAQGSGNLAASDGVWSQGQFSPGDGATTFRIPDLRGEFIRSWDDARGVDAGRAIGSSQADELKSHTHPTGQSGTTFGAAVVTHAVGIGSGNTLATGGAETRPRNIALLACLKY